jgi:hypothetical protein
MMTNILAKMDEIYIFANKKILRRGRRGTLVPY